VTAVPRLDRPGVRRYIPAVLRGSPVSFFLLSLAAVLPLTGCDSGGAEIRDRTVRVGCGMCRFGMEGSSPGCYWAAEIDGRTVPVNGEAIPNDHDNHAPGGMCNVTRDAIVSGTLYESQLVVTRFDLQPVDPAEEPEFGPEDVH